jgi:hypothetical protein
MRHSKFFLVVFLFLMGCSMNQQKNSDAQRGEKDVPIISTQPVGLPVPVSLDTPVVPPQPTAPPQPSQPSPGQGDATQNVDNPGTKSRP